MNQYASLLNHRVAIYLIVLLSMARDRLFHVGMETNKNSRKLGVFYRKSKVNISLYHNPEFVQLEMTHKIVRK